MEYVRLAEKHIEELGWIEEEPIKLKGTHLEIARQDIEGNDRIDTFQKNVILYCKRQIEIDGVKVNFLGDGGEIKFRMNNDGSIINASKVWRKIEKIGKPVPVKSYDEAYNEAYKQLENPRMYRLADWAWGYKEFEGNIFQKELGIVFDFGFLPIDNCISNSVSPRRIEILGQKRRIN